MLLAWNPYNLLDAGFQLSFAAVVAIFVAVPRARRFLEGYPLPRARREAIAVSLACGVATAPILWLQFGRIPIYSVLANALAAPVVAPLLGLSFVAAIIAPLSPPVAGRSRLDERLARRLSRRLRTADRRAARIDDRLSPRRLASARCRCSAFVGASCSPARGRQLEP